ncbi:MAG: ABC-F family ATP-binding cassette domain-containing protein [Planctomycetota bacterium]
MALLTASRLGFAYQGDAILEEINLKVEPGARIGIIGRNGSGKSTLLRLFAGKLEPNTGAVRAAPGATLAFQAQELDVPMDRTVLETMHDVFADDRAREARLRELEALMADADEHDRLLKEYERLTREQEARGYRDLDRHIETMLLHLGLDESAWERPVREFSGGERNILGLARALLQDPDLLVLDEPSNHLDMDGVEWFIDFLRKSKAAVVMVSHNRHLLDATTREIWELERRRITCWTGNYSDFQRQKAEALALQERQFRTQQRLIKRIEFQARRLRDMANAYDDPGQAKRAKAMMRRVEQMDKVDAPKAAERTFAANFGGAERHGRIALKIRDFSLAFGERVLFDGASLDIEYGERVCLVGPNGSGKSSLFRRILDEGDWENPTLRLGKSVHAGEYRQLHDILDPKQSLIDWAMQTTGLTRTPAADLLHRFLFSFDDLERAIGTLSGGEKSRLQLARLVHEQVNFLLLDEPTNHIDIASCEQLEEMLEEYDGTLLVISHDRYFLDRIIDRVVEVQDRGLVDHPKTFAEWYRDRAAARRTALVDRRARDEEKEDARKAFEERKEKNRELHRMRTRLKKLEASIAELEARHEALKARLETVYVDASTPGEAESVHREFQEVRASIEEAYAEWETLALQLGE